MEPLLKSARAEDTSLALPSMSSVTASMKHDKNLRVLTQVHQTLRRKGTLTGGVKVPNSPSSLDGAEGSFSKTKVNGFQFSSPSFKGTHVQSMSRRAGVGSQWESHSHSKRDIRSVTALMDWNRSNSPHYAVSEVAFPMNTHPSMSSSRPSMKSMSYKQPVGGKSRSASLRVQQSYRENQCLTQNAVRPEKLSEQQSLKSMSGSSQPNRGLSSHAQMSLRGESNRHFTVYPDMGMKQDTRNTTNQSWQPVQNPPAMTLEKALNRLGTRNEEELIRAIKYIQKQCFGNEKDRKRVHSLDGVEKLLPLLQNESEEVQFTAAAALRNVVYLNQDNKTKVKELEGLKVILDALKSTHDKETKRQLAGLLWNLSADDTIKECFTRQFLSIITKSILVPSSGVNGAENLKDEMMADPDAFLCATGCLRNLSSAGLGVRSNMRKCEKLIDSLVYYTSETAASHSPQDKATEHCVCILQNLTYEAEEDFPRTPTPQEETQDAVAEKTTVGCFPGWSAKLTNNAKNKTGAENVELCSSPKKEEPHGAELLWSENTVRIYLSLVACSEDKGTQQAALGALQNLTAGKGKISESVASTIKKNQLNEIKKAFNKEKKPEDCKLRNSVILLIRNLSAFPDLHTNIFDLMLGDLNLLSSSDSKTSSVMTEHQCRILENLIKDNEKRAREMIKHEAVRKILQMKHEESGSKKNISSKADEAVRDLENTFKKHKLTVPT